MKQVFLALSAAALLTVGLISCNKKEIINSNNPVQELTTKKGNNNANKGIPTLIGEFHNNALDHLFNKWDEVKEDKFINVTNKEDFISICDNMFIKEYNIFSKGTEFESNYPEIPQHMCVLRDKVSDITLPKINRDDVIHQIISFQNEMRQNKAAIENLYSKADYLIVESFFETSLDYLTTNNHSNFTSEINKLISKWHQEKFKRGEFQGLLSGAVLGIAKYSQRYWSSNQHNIIVLDIENDDPQPVAPWVIADAAGAAGSLLYDAASAAAGADVVLESALIDAAVNGVLTSVGGKWGKSVLGWLGW